MFVSRECEDKLKPYYDGDYPDVPSLIMPNPAPSAFSNTDRTYNEILGRLLVVSNHPPMEILDAVSILRANGIECDIIGSNGEYRLIDESDILKTDAVVTIGKTVQYCLVSGTPVYVYGVC